MKLPLILIIEIILTGITVYYTLIHHRSKKRYYRLYRDIKHLISITVCCVVRFLVTIGAVELGGYVIIFDGLIVLSIIVLLLFAKI